MKKEKVLVIGAARSGLAAAKLLLDHEYQVILTDNRNKENILKSNPSFNKNFSNYDNLELVFGRQIDPERLSDIDFIVTSPGVPETVPVISVADQTGVPILSEPELAYRLSNTPFVAVTGTNGKTTTTTLLGEIFKNSGKETFIVGNIGDAVSNYVDTANEDSIFVTEIGSFQLDRCHEFKPKAAVILNITPDHLDRHKTMENYINAKAKIFQSQDKQDFAILNADDSIVKELEKDIKANKLYISLKHEVEGAYYKDGILYFNLYNEIIPVISKDDLGIKGPHNIQNALAASLLAYVNNVPIEVIRNTLKDFKGVEHRQEDVGEYDGVQYINDSKATNTDAAITALNAMERPVILIAGGYDKKEDYTNFSKKVKEKVKKAVLLGETRMDIKNSFDKEGFSEYILVDSFDEAVKTARQLAEPGDVVLLSPACASWDMFENYEQRGDQFRKLIVS